MIRVDSPGALNRNKLLIAIELHAYQPTKIDLFVMGTTESDRCRIYLNHNTQNANAHSINPTGNL